VGLQRGGYAAPPRGHDVERTHARGRRPRRARRSGRARPPRTPGSKTFDRSEREAADALGLRLLAYDRRGDGGCRRTPGAASPTSPTTSPRSSTRSASRAPGVAGRVDDDYAFLAPWGFDRAAMRVPVRVWQGEEDLMVPPSHGHWLLRHVAGAESEGLPGEGHLTFRPLMGEILGWLRARLD
jgi:pimeloyl-ACP methyl ester carboxylesterase